MSLVYLLVASLLLVAAIAAGTVPLLGRRLRPQVMIPCFAILFACTQLPRYIPGLNMSLWVDAFLLVYVLALSLVFYSAHRHRNNPKTKEKKDESPGLPDPVLLGSNSRN